jgi:hypothetical protein
MAVISELFTTTARIYLTTGEWRLLHAYDTAFSSISCAGRRQVQHKNSSILTLCLRCSDDTPLHECNADGHTYYLYASYAWQAEEISHLVAVFSKLRTISPVMALFRQCCSYYEASATNCLHHLTSSGCRSGHYQTRVYPAPESPQALGFVPQSLHLRCWCAYSGHLLLGAPASSQTLDA